MKEQENLFRYESDNFSVLLNGDYRKVNWAEIEEIQAYKLDLLTTDEVCIDLVLKTSIITITEEIGGWELFVDTLMKQFPSIQKDWEHKVTLPPFDTNFTILYKKSISADLLSGD